MIYLVIGTADSGKSALAEDIAVSTGDAERIYLATMKVMDEAGEKRIEKHRRMREGKGFLTVEKLYGVSAVLRELKDPDKTTVLLECVSNLVGNELHENPARAVNVPDFADGDDPKGKKAALADEIAEDIKKLALGVHNIVIVTNGYERDGEGYDEDTRLFVQVLDMVNERIMLFSDEIRDLRKGK